MPKNTPFQKHRRPHWLSGRQRGAEAQERWRRGGPAPQPGRVGGVAVCSPNLSRLSLQRLCGLCQFSSSVRRPNYPSEEARGGEGEPCQTPAPGGTLPSNLQRLQRPCRLRWPLFHLLQRLLPSPTHRRHVGSSHIVLACAAGDGTSHRLSVTSQGPDLLKSTPELLQPARRACQLPS